MKDEVKTKKVTLPVVLPEKLVAMFVEQRELKKANRKKEKKMHEVIWETIYEEFPDLSRDENYSCDLEYMDSGVVFLKESDGCGLGGLFAEVLSSAIKRD